ncbi:alcohol dehydrogenase catalytic domain-containing protein [Patulibacter sp.]|uniref:alcohol dehydrogenase catalytic domain-containing protein n=1 Tax=Patulibacter sp. TaxID=1912859 RepID=UPI002722545D|nr:alcohol dehydrogenase catalytic domain-containing protein [Patulibacter sp.]MDO9409003.1 alcohol dehydrogenase catalytic domain-containing protein [Patulibacter sp.]
MTANRGVTFQEPGVVEVTDVDEPDFVLRDAPGINPANAGRRCDHGVIVKVLASCICGSDIHMVRGRAPAPAGLVLGHEMTGEVVAIGRDVETLEVGDVISVPFNVACGRCRACSAGQTAICEGANPGGAGAAFGYPGLGGWAGVQSQYALAPFADFNALKFPDREQAREILPDLAMLADIFPTGFHGAVSAGVGPGSVVYVAGAGPVGLAAACSAQLLGAAVVVVGDLNADRLAQARSFGCETIDLTAGVPLPDAIEAIVGVPEVDAAIDCVGFMARGHGPGADGEAPATVLNSLMGIARPGAHLGIPGAYVSSDGGGTTEASRNGVLGVDFGVGWGRSLVLHTGGCPAKRYQPALMKSILHGRVKIADAVGATVVPLEDAAAAYAEFDQGAAKKFVLDPHGLLAAGGH